MATFDVRDEDDLIDTIVFASEDDNWFNVVELRYSSSDDIISISDSNRETKTIIKKDIPNLIKALQKAQQIWKD